MLNTDVDDMNAEPATQARTVLNEQGKPVLLDLCELCDSGVLAVYQLARFGEPGHCGQCQAREVRSATTEHRRAGVPLPALRLRGDQQGRLRQARPAPARHHHRGGDA